MDVPTNFIWIAVLFDEAFKYGGGTKFCGYVETSTEPLSEELRNFVWCHLRKPLNFQFACTSISS
jgi:hypothetical protein